MITHNINFEDFLKIIKKNNVYPCKPQFDFLKVWINEFKITKACFVMKHIHTKYNFPFGIILKMIFIYLFVYS